MKKNMAPKKLLVASQFQCIIRPRFCITPYLLEDLIRMSNYPNFQIGEISATVYPLADCSFIERLPSMITDAKLLSAIADQLGEKNLTKLSFYVQLNKKKSSAVVLTPKSTNN